MADCPLKARIVEDMKTAMRARDAEKLAVIRLILSDIKQKEVDERIVLDDAQVMVILDKMLKKRRESITQYRAGNREDLAVKEEAEIVIIQHYLPTQMSVAEIEALLRNAIEKAQAKDVKDMGKVMAIIKPELQGRADMTVVSAQLKELLGV
jgi:uncharacterized protein